MKVSTKGRYGLRAMVDLAIHSSESHEPLYRIAKRQEMSLNYLEQVFGALRKAGFVKSIKGAQGGYELTKKTDEIRVGDLLRVLEGDISLVDEKKEYKTDYQQAIRECLDEMVWSKMDEVLNELIDDMTLEDLIEEYNERNGIQALMYYI